MNEKAKACLVNLTIYEITRNKLINDNINKYK